jgi:hypothetical protein
MRAIASMSGAYPPAMLTATGTRSASPEHDGVAPPQTGHRQSHASQSIALVRIGAGEIEDQIGRCGQHAIQGRLQLPEIPRIVDAVGQRHIEVAALLVERIVAGPVHRTGEHTWVVGEDRRRPVALMHVEVDHRHLADPSGLEQRHRRHRDVVEHAIPFTAIAESVMRAAGQVGRDAIPERGACRRECPTDRPARPFNHLRRPRETDAPLLLGGQPAVAHARHVVGGVDAFEVAPGDGVWFDEVAVAQ